MSSIRRHDFDLAMEEGIYLYDSFPHSFVSKFKVYPFSVLFTAAAQHLHHIADRLKPKRSFLQSIFCCWRKARTKTTQNGTPIDGTITPPPTQGSQKYLLPQVRHSDMHRKCMVIDLDETLVHSSFKVSTSITCFALL